MKKLLILSALISLILSSCQTPTDHSPQIGVRYLGINDKPIQSTSTPVAVGDTLKISLALFGYYNELTNFTVQYDSEYAKDSIFSTAELNKYFDTDRTDVESGSYVFKPEIYELNANVKLIAKRAKQDESKPIRITFALKSTSVAEVEFNPHILEIDFKITDNK